MQLAVLVIGVIALAVAVPVLINKILPSKGSEPDVHKGIAESDPKVWTHGGPGDGV